MEVTGSCTFEGGFQKGMTLEQYMLCGDRGRNTVKQEERKDEESLYDNCRQISLKSSNKLMVNYCINEIDEESYEESTDYF